MKDQKNKSKYNLVFSEWKRKDYAVFASLHKVIKIAHLSVDICIASLRGNKSVIRVHDQLSGSSANEKELYQEKEGLPDWLTGLLLKFDIITIEKDCYPKYKYSFKLNNVRILQIAGFGHCFLYT
ncbi:MAG: hypothetical protein Q8T04_03035 [Bacteroidota bacterium]|nr:hypothetical protein [Bacteroidota bacterium]